MTSAFARELRAARRPQSLADLISAGVTADMTRSRRWRRSIRGFFVPANSPFTTTQRILDISPPVPAGGAVAGWPRRTRWGVDLLDGQDAFTMAALPVPIHLGRELGRTSPPGVRFVRERLPAAHHQIVHGLPVTRPLRTMFDGGRWADGLTEAVVFLDQVAHALQLDLDELQPWCVPGPRRPGVKQLRAALALADARTASLWESRLRMFYLQQARLPRPLVNRPVFDLDGRFLGTPDLFDPEAGLVTEFDGKDHRMRRRHQADNIREEKLEGSNLTVCRVDSLDLRQPVPLTERLQARHAQGMRRNRELDRWTLNEPSWWQRRRRAA